MTNGLVAGNLHIIVSFFLPAYPLYPNPQDKVHETCSLVHDVLVVRLTPKTLSIMPAGLRATATAAGANAALSGG